MGETFPLVCDNCGLNEATDDAWFDLPFVDGKFVQICPNCEPYIRYCGVCLRFFTVKDISDNPRKCPKCSK